MFDSTSVLIFFKWLNDDIFALPGTVLFFGAAVILTIKTGFIQIRAIPHFARLISKGIREKKEQKALTTATNAINPFHALFTALASSIGMGNVVGPGTAIITGGPGALFWLVIYIGFASVTKFTEVMFALHTRTRTSDGKIIGGPMEYLKAVTPFLAHWYAAIMATLLAGWCAMQSNTLANIYAIESVPRWSIGLLLAVITAHVLGGGAQRVGAVASKLVPVMTILYVSFSLFILLKYISALQHAFVLIKNNIFSPAAPIGGFLGATIFQAMRYGMFRGVFISESGLGTASIPHAMANTKHHIDQGVLAMGSTIADMTLSMLSGLLVLVTGIWMRGGFSVTLVYEIFKEHTSAFGQLALLTSVSLFVLTTIIGNSFSGLQNFTSLSKGRWSRVYMGLVIMCVFVGSISSVPLLWEMMDTVLVLAAIPNLLGLLYLAFKYPYVLHLSQE
jgi:AGCS family alanine or glycine:cation symporter